MEQTIGNSKNIRADRETVYQALNDPRALEAWQAPRDMTAKIKDFDLKAGGGYQMSLFYPENEKEVKGKSFAREDRYKARFVKLTPRERIVQAINFETSDPVLWVK